MNYNDGYTLAKEDIKRFGYLHAMDKLHLFEGDFGQGYSAGIDESLADPSQALRLTR